VGTLDSVLGKFFFPLLFPSNPLAGFIAQQSKLDKVNRENLNLFVSVLVPLALYLKEN
jgi:hypothetical protein